MHILGPSEVAVTTQKINRHSWRVYRGAALIGTVTRRRYKGDRGGTATEFVTRRHGVSRHGADTLRLAIRTLVRRAEDAERSPTGREDY